MLQALREKSRTSRRRSRILGVALASLLVLLSLGLARCPNRQGHPESEASAVRKVVGEAPATPTPAPEFELPDPPLPGAPVAGTLLTVTLRAAEVGVMLPVPASGIRPADWDVMTTDLAPQTAQGLDVLRERVDAREEDVDDALRAFQAQSHDPLALDISRLLRLQGFGWCAEADRAGVIRDGLQLTSSKNQTLAVRAMELLAATYSKSGVLEDHDPGGVHIGAAAARWSAEGATIPLSVDWYLLDLAIEAGLPDLAASRASAYEDRLKTVCERNAAAVCRGFQAGLDLELALSADWDAEGPAGTRARARWAVFRCRTQFDSPGSPFQFSYAPRDGTVAGDGGQANFVACLSRTLGALESADTTELDVLVLP